MAVVVVLSPAVMVVVVVATVTVVRRAVANVVIASLETAGLFMVVAVAVLRAVVVSMW